MFRLGLSNLQLRSNLLPEDYQGEYKHRAGKRIMAVITAHEVKDIWRRNPLLKDYLTREQHQEWIARLFDGDTSVSMAECDRARAWLEQLAENMEEALASLEDRADAERAFEVLCVAESLADPRLDSTYAAKAAVWAQRARAILERPEFRLTPQMIDDRLTQALGVTSGKLRLDSPTPRTFRGPSPTQVPGAVRTVHVDGGK
jgi:hypothetical protein